jgi:gamma-glutamylcysteine synthetase
MHLVNLAAVRAMSQDRLLDALLARSVSHAEIRNVNTSIWHAFEIEKDEIAFLLLVIIFFFMFRMVFLNVALVSKSTVW